MLEKIKEVFRKKPFDIICCLLFILVSSELIYTLLFSNLYTNQGKVSNSNECEKKKGVLLSIIYHHPF